MQHVDHLSSIYASNELFRQQRNVHRQHGVRTGRQIRTSDVCNKLFMQQWSLKEYRRIHTGVMLSIAVLTFCLLLISGGKDTRMWRHVHDE